MPETLKDYPITLSFPIHWSEMDAYGHANNARYFVWFESARITYLTRIGLDKGTLYARGGGVIVTMRYPEYEKIPISTEVRAAIEALEGRSFAPPA